MIRSATVAGIALMLAAGSAEAKSASPFAGLAGGWSGFGNASFEGGRSERLRCTASYQPSGNNLHLTIRCANPSLNIQLNGNLRNSGGRVTGSWSESSMGVGGSAAGRATATGIRLRIGGDVSGNLAVSFSGSSQTVTISTNSTAFRHAKINMKKR